MLKLPVANQLKANMFEEAVKYVTLREGEIWSSVAELTKHLKTFEEAEVKGSASRQLDILNVVREKQSDHRLNSKAAGAQKRETPKGFALPKNGQRGGCFECGSTKYYEANCPHAHTKGPGKEDWRKKEKGESLMARVATKSLIYLLQKMWCSYQGLFESSNVCGFESIGL